MVKITLKEQEFLSKNISWFAMLGNPLPNKIMSLDSSLSDALHFYHSNSDSKKNSIYFSKGSRVLVSNKSKFNTPWKEILVDNPRLELAKLSRSLRDFRDNSVNYKMKNGSWISDKANIGSDCVIHPGSVIGDSVTIGNHCKVGSGVVLRGRLHCGNNCSFHSGSIIGSDGFGYSMKGSTPVLQVAHLGGVDIGHDVDIGPSSVVSSGTIDPTCIGNNVKIDGNVYIGHNAFLGDKVVVTAGVVIGGSSSIGSRTWMYPNSTIKTKIHIGSDATIGLGSSVVRDVLDGETVMGSVAENIRKKISRNISIDNLLK
jgi:UDP-3-O-[3-hydroxymyristoyl] glucosamine N-acyltransferase